MNNYDEESDSDNSIQCSSSNIVDEIQYLSEETWSDTLTNLQQYALENGSFHFAAESFFFDLGYDELYSDSPLFVTFKYPKILDFLLGKVKEKDPICEWSWYSDIYTVYVTPLDMAVSCPIVEWRSVLLFLQHGANPFGGSYQYEDDGMRDGGIRKWGDPVHVLFRHKESFATDPELWKQLCALMFKNMDKLRADLIEMAIILLSPEEELLCDTPFVRLVYYLHRGHLFNQELVQIDHTERFDFDMQGLLVLTLKYEKYEWLNFFIKHFQLERGIITGAFVQAAQKFPRKAEFISQLAQKLSIELKERIGMEDDRYIFRVLRCDERMENGLSPKDPNSEQPLSYHVRYGGRPKVKTAWISHSDLLEVAMNQSCFFRTVVATDLMAIPNSMVEDTRLSGDSYHKPAKDLANRWREVAVKGKIPARALTEIHKRCKVLRASFLGNEGDFPSSDQFSTLKVEHEFSDGINKPLKMSHNSRLYVLKTSLYPDHEAAEFQANQIYRAHGVSVRDCALYSCIIYWRDPSEKTLREKYLIRNFLLFKYQEESGFRLNQLPDERKIAVRENLAKGSMLDWLINNYDVTGVKGNNVIILENNEVIRLDVGSCFDFGATGNKSKKKKNGKPSFLPETDKLFVSDDSLKELEKNLQKFWDRHCVNDPLFGAKIGVENCLEIIALPKKRETCNLL